jgi:uncharacterized protein YigE (DUF2233 family)
LAKGFVALVVLLAAPAAAGDAEWRELEPGLALLEWTAKRKSSHGDSVIRILRVDPEKFSLRLVSAKATQSKNRSARDWAHEEGLVAAINASMFAADRRTSVALMLTAGHVNNSHLGKDNAVLAFDPLVGGVPAAQIIDRQCQDFGSLRAKYASLVQNIRMISCDGKNVWAQQARRWSIATVAVDRKGRVLFIHSRSPHTVHDFIDELLAAPIEVKNAMYVEGGPEAQLYIKSGDFEGEWLGSFETGFFESDDNDIGWRIPNVIGVVRK